ncbi:Aldolase-type TIM barrel [Penicillium concentricum]|uniref:Tryptophan synthase n=1 Tax=Penicillium concentricum TaxID=293559 RepID=A0A9W9VDB5_9EURO|nr:Aldolase-type TIM barrel [Penicillium concentricum]KAJ5375236.1 Aldolase-type TIM barrel [Penicillium concentricum]
MEAINEAFAKCKAKGRAALITYVTAGYPTVSETPEIMMSMQAGGADIIELGIPSTDPVTESPTIQQANAKALENGVEISHILQMVKSARKQGLAVPVLLVGYYNPVRAYAYGEQKLLRDCKAAGVDGFIIVDVPPDNVMWFRDLCKSKGLSYIPLIASSTPNAHLKMLCNIADSFVCIAARMGVSGMHEKPYECVGDLLHRMHACTENLVPVAVGFGINTRESFVDIARPAEGVVIGSPIISILGNTAPGTGAQKVKEYCLQVAGRTEHEIVITERKNQSTQSLSSTTIYLSYDGAGDTPKKTDKTTSLGDINTRLRTFGGQYVPGFLIEGITELENGFEAANADPTFWAEINSYAAYANRPSSLHLAPRLTEYAGGARIWLKREDLDHTGSHKINNALGQIILARRLGKTSIIAETGAGQHGVATATICAQFGIKCTVFMGSEDFESQPLVVLRMRILGAVVNPVDAAGGGKKGTLRDAVNEAFRTWARELKTTHFVIGSAFGPHPYPTIVRKFQAVIGAETRVQFGAMNSGRLPDAIVACVGGGSNAVGMFYPFLEDSSVALVGVEAGGDGSLAEQHPSSLGRASVGVLHGLRNSLPQDEDEEIRHTHFVSAGLDYPGVGFELSSWKESGRATFIAANDTEALMAFSLLCRLEGIMPALESSHAVAGAVRVAKKLGPGRDVVVCLSGRGDKDVQTVAHVLSTLRVDNL